MTSSALRFRRADKTELEELLRHSRAQTLKIFALYEQAIGSTGFSVPQVDILNAPL